MAGKEPATRPSFSFSSSSSSFSSDDAAHEKATAFIGYHPFPPILNLHYNYSGILSAPNSYKLCGETEADFLYLVELHFGYSTRGPFPYGRGVYLRNGTTNKDPILAAAGEEYRIPLLVGLFDPKTAVKMPPVDREKNPRDMVTENLQSAKSKQHGVAFRFAIEVGAKRLRREGFEWRKPMGGSKADGEGEGAKGSRYTLIRLAPELPPPTASSSSAAAGAASSSSAPPEPAEEVVAELTFRNVLSVKHIFTLELKGAGLTGELGERWSLMVVMTALDLNYLRQLGRTNKTTVGAAQKLHSK